MKLLFASFTLLAAAAFPQSALAWCDNPETGESKLFSVSIYTASACNPNDKFADGIEIIEFYSKDNWNPITLCHTKKTIVIA